MIHEASVGFIVARWTDVVPEDIIVIDSAQYRIKTITRTPMAPDKELVLERVDQPIYPVPEATTS